MDLEFIRPVIKYLPEVKIPRKHVSFKEKLMWTFSVLVLFFVMGVIYPTGVSRADIPEAFQIYQIIFASNMGSLISVGIGPIVTSSIILQLLVGSKMIDLDLNRPDNQALFQGAQKILTVLIAFFEAGGVVIGFHLGGGFLGEMWNMMHPLVLFIIFQIALGSILLMFLDEVVSKWGVGSGIGLFIAGGVSQQIMTASLSFLKTDAGGFAGRIPYTIVSFLNGEASFFGLFSSAYLFPMLAVVIVFLVVVLGESMRLEIPLSYGGIRGVGGRYPLKFFYVSNIPVILAAALLANIRMWAQIVGVDISNPPTNPDMLQEIVYQVGHNVTLGNLYGVLSPDNLGMFLEPNILLHLLVYTIAFTGLCIVFGKFWVETTGLSAENVADQIQGGGMQIPGFRRDKRVIERVLNRYIPQITIISSVAVGLLALVADLMGAFGSGTGILLTVGILHNLYEQIQREQMSEMHPAFRRFMGRE
ncbi:MAG: preprotein translocase subunit SecY [Candidatus Altiarchaeales archaeon ex4484_96]|nr:MAG: preprotein translocase subunit SecY [Candidatus Altiarchaeales archaeon ex4484_96]